MRRPYAIAVVGLGGVFPSAPDVPAYWRNILACHDASREVPADRWPAPPEWFARNGAGADGVASLRACLLESIPEPKNAAAASGLDDLCRLSLRAAEMTLEDARGQLPDLSKVATILASIALPTLESSRLSEEVFLETLAQSLSPSPAAKKPSVDPIWRQVTGRPAEVVADALGLGGFTLTLDAACASSLYAVKLACDALTDGRADAVLAGGANRADNLYTQAGFTALGALSPSGRCSPFDHKGDGLVVGEGAGFLLLKRLDDALAQGDRVYAVIRGIGLSNDVGGSLLAPDSEGQLRALIQAYGQAGWKPEEVGLVECHGTGTPMGDKTEFNSLREFWQQKGESSSGTVLGSVKSQIGHLLTGAGAAGLIKVIKAIESRTLPPMNNFESPSRGIRFEGTPFRVLSSPEPWTSEGPLRAGVSAFGFGGINGHVLLEEPGSPAPPPPAKVEPQILEEVVITAVGMQLGEAHDLERFLLDRQLNRSASAPRPEGRWPATDNRQLGALDEVWGAYLKALQVEAGEFRVPPKDMPDILLQQTLFLAAAHKATEQSSLGPKERCRRSGALIGISLDLETTNFHLRWALPRMLERLGLEASELDTQSRARLRDALSRPLDSTRTLGALGSIAASRAAREFSLGGPSYAISCGELSGVRALEIGLRAIQNGEMDSCLVGAIDLAGDPRSVWAEDQLRPYARGGPARPFDVDGQGPTVAEGAVALVLKSRSAAEADGDRILAVLDEVLATSGPRALIRNLEGLARKLDGAWPGFVDVMSRADTSEDTRYLKHYGKNLPPLVSASDAASVQRTRPTAFGTLAGSLGQGGAMAGLLSVISAALALDTKVIPGVVGLRHPLPTPPGTYLPREAAFWWHDEADGPRRAVSVGHASGVDSHLVLLREGNTQARPPGAAGRALALPSQIFLIPISELPRLARRAADAEDIVKLARDWYRDTSLDQAGPRGAVVARNRSELLAGLGLLASCAKGESPPMDGQAGVFFSPQPLRGETAWVFPGSGGHYVGMGRELAVLFPEVAATINGEASTSYQHYTPWLTQPFRVERGPGWETEALAAIEADPLAPIFSQVTFAILAARVLGLFLPQPEAALGYSLGETAALFATGAWKARDLMFQRTVASPLFTRQLRTKYETAKQVLGLTAEASFHWSVAVVKKPESEVRESIAASARRDIFLLIVDSPEECVIGGQTEAVEEISLRLGCKPFFLEGVPTVHCALMHPVADSYRELHRLPTTPPPGMRFYNGHRHHAYIPDTESAATSITENAQFGFSFPQLIGAAYRDGVRHFIEIGPSNSCARMIGGILDGREFWTRSLSLPRVEEGMSLIRLLASAYVHGSDLTLEALYPQTGSEQARANRPIITVQAGSTLPRPLHPPLVRKPLTMAPAPKANGRSTAPPLTSPPPPRVATQTQATSAPARPALDRPQAPASAPGRFKKALVWSSPQASQPKTLTKDGHVMISPTPASGELTPVIGLHPDYSGDPSARLAASIVESTRQTAMAHESYLALMESTRLRMEALLSGVPASLAPPQRSAPPQQVDSPWAKLDPTHPNPLMRGERPRDAEAWLNRAMCMEFAVGSIEKVLGPEFASVDKRSVRVRLPDEPLMLCDRIMGVEGEAGALRASASSDGRMGRPSGAMTGGRLITEHDVFPESWYLDHDRAPVCISVEAGQADLFLSSYLGIDLVTNPDRAYRLLDATISFQRGLPQPGETIVYDIRISRFVCQGDVYLFFFEFDGTIDGQPLITMRKGCAGFHTAAEIEASGGIVLTKRERQPMPGKAPTGWKPPAPFPRGLGAVESYSDAQVQAFRSRNLESCFGPSFAGLPFQRPYGLPEGRMKLFDRVTLLQADGGRFGLGRIEAEADIRPDDWFLTCHFPDDMVMPGTLMYECCAHTLRFLLARMGWLAEEAAVAFEPKPNTPAALKCRGPVTVKTRKVLYQVDIKEIGFGPEPYVLADALMFGDGKQIVRFEDMSMQLTGLTAADIEAVWARQQAPQQPTEPPHTWTAPPALYDKESIMQFSNGRPSLAFGPEYTVFDNERRIARLPGPPYQFMDRVVEVNQPKFVLKAGGWIEAHYDVAPNEWYFGANRQDSMAYCILLEAALQPCGWLAAYVGSALRSQTDVKFRNLGGTATLHKEFFPNVGTVRMRVKMTDVSEAGGMIIENFAMQMWVGDELYYDGTTYFGFFSAAALANQLGVRDAAQRTYTPSPDEWASARPTKFTLFHPFDPDDARVDAGPSACMPAKALLMMDQVDLFLPNSGLQGLGYVQGSKIVDPEEWFFKAHFYQDPVWPGSLGLEAFLQLIKYAALKTWPECMDTHRFEPIAVGLPHTWAYRGQVIPKNKKVIVDVSITRREDGPSPLLLGQGFLRVDGIPIYEMTDFGLRLVPV